MIYLEDGRIAAQGTYEQVRENERFISLLQEFNSGGLGGDADDDADSIQVHNLAHRPVRVLMETKMTFPRRNLTM